MEEKIYRACLKMEEEFHLIPPMRQDQLMLLSDYIRNKQSAHQKVQLIVICTHNSRRSHMGQIWLAVGADYYNIPDIETYSGGTEATAFNPNAVAAFQRLGFEIHSTGSENPEYHISWDNEKESYVAFSKKYDDVPNPSADFGAIMVCTSADEGCPIVQGATFRLSLPFDDPKAFDGTEQEREKYDERCWQIGREMLFALSKI